MVISGIQKFTLIDYPGKTACVVFTGGCNFRCGFCHNPEFVLPEQLEKIKETFIPERAVFNFLKKRTGLLEGVVVTGGEPTVMRDLPDFVRRVRELGFLVKLDTNGNNPDMLERLLEDGIIDYVAMDIKISPARYPELSGAGARAESIKRSIELIKTRAPEYEFRTTMIKELHDITELHKMGEAIAGSRYWYLQGFRPAHTLDPKFKDMRPFSEEEMNALVPILAPYTREILVRPA